MSDNNRQGLCSFSFRRRALLHSCSKSTFQRCSLLLAVLESTRTMILSLVRNKFRSDSSLYDLRFPRRCSSPSSWMGYCVGRGKRSQMPFLHPSKCWSQCGLIYQLFCSMRSHFTTVLFERKKNCSVSRTCATLCF